MESSYLTGLLQVRHVWSYDDLGRPLGRDTGIAGNVATTAWSWRPDGQLDAITHPSGITVGYQYDPAHPARLQGIGATGAPYWQVTTRDARGAPTLVELPQSGEQIDLTYDVAGRVATRSSGLVSRTRTYDHGGRLSTESVSTASGSWVDSYTYDGAGRLTTEVHGATGATLHYALDRAGNRQSTQTTTGSVVDTVPFGYSGAVLDAVDGIPVGRDAFEAVTTDQHGTQYDRLPDGRVGVVSSGAAWAKFTRGPDGLSWQTEEHDGNVRRAHWDLDPGGPPAEVADNSGTRTYLRAGAEVVGVLVNGAWVPAEEDGQGSVVREGATLGDGTAFGEGAKLPGVDERFLFAGLESLRSDLGSAMSARHRMYDPQSGRFMSPDPIGLQGGANRFAYANGDPVQLRDPLGFSACGTTSGQVQLPSVQLQLRTYGFESLPENDGIFGYLDPGLGSAVTVTEALGAAMGFDASELPQPGMRPLQGSRWAGTRWVACRSWTRWGVRQERAVRVAGGRAARKAWRAHRRELRKAGAWDRKVEQEWDRERATSKRFGLCVLFGECKQRGTRLHVDLGDLMAGTRPPSAVRSSFREAVDSGRGRRQVAPGKRRCRRWRSSRRPAVSPPAGPVWAIRRRGSRRAERRTARTRHLRQPVTGPGESGSALSLMFIQTNTGILYSSTVNYESIDSGTIS
ncbi:MAG: RHS repeat-associated core domain-containing protein [Myxococcota bacterium]